MTLYEKAAAQAEGALAERRRVLAVLDAHTARFRKMGPVALDSIDAAGVAGALVALARVRAEVEGDA